MDKNSMYSCSESYNLYLNYFFMTISAFFFTDNYRNKTIASHILYNNCIEPTNTIREREDIVLFERKKSEIVFTCSRKINYCYY